MNTRTKNEEPNTQAMNYGVTFDDPIGSLDASEGAVVTRDYSYFYANFDLESLLEDFEERKVEDGWNEATLHSTNPPLSRGAYLWETKHGHAHNRPGNNSSLRNKQKLQPYEENSMTHCCTQGSCAERHRSHRSRAERRIYALEAQVKQKLGRPMTSGEAYLNESESGLAQYQPEHTCCFRNSNQFIQNELKRYEENWNTTDGIEEESCCSNRCHAERSSYELEAQVKQKLERPMPSGEAYLNESESGLAQYQPEHTCCFRNSNQFIQNELKRYEENWNTTDGIEEESCCSNRCHAERSSYELPYEENSMTHCWSQGSCAERLRSHRSCAERRRSHRSRAERRIYALEAQVKQKLERPMPSGSCCLCESDGEHSQHNSGIQIRGPAETDHHSWSRKRYQAKNGSKILKRHRSRGRSHASSEVPVYRRKDQFLDPRVQQIVKKVDRINAEIWPLTRSSQEFEKRNLLVHQTFVSTNIRFGNYYE